MHFPMWVAFGALCSVAIAQPPPNADAALSITSSGVEPTPTLPNGYPALRRRHDAWLLQKRATTDDAAAAETTAETTAEETTAEETTAAETTAAETTSADEATSTTEATTSEQTTTAETTSTTSSTSSTTSSTSSTTSSTSQSTTTSATSTTKSTTTSSTTTSSTSSATTTESAAMREYNRRGEIAAAVVWPIVLSVFIGIGLYSCLADRLKKKQAAAKAAAPAATASYSMMPLGDHARSQSSVNFDRSSMMFATQSRSDLEAMAGASPTQPRPMTRPSSISPNVPWRACDVVGEKSVVTEPRRPALIALEQAWNALKARRGLPYPEGTDLAYLENRVRELETGEDVTSTHKSRFNTLLRLRILQLVHTRPTWRDGRSTEDAAGASPAVSASSRITRDQPLAHEGLPLAYARRNEHEPGPTDPAHGPAPCEVQQFELPSMAECQQYAEMYFAASSMYPFISQDFFYAILGEAFRFRQTSTWESRLPVKLALTQVFLVLSLGARFLETKLGSTFSSRDWFATGMSYATQINLHESAEGVQILLLLVQHNFYSPEGLNAWYLLHTIIASCLDLGLQRRDNSIKETESAHQRTTRHLRSAIFWSAYSMDRTLTTILGRPLTLRDEAIDREFPGFDTNDEVEDGAIYWEESAPIAEATRALDAAGPYIARIYSLRFDRIVAEIKLMLYRVSRSPRRFPWPTDVARWQQDAEKACLLLATGSAKSSAGTSTGWPHSLVGGHVSQPTEHAIQVCFTSAMDSIAIHADLHRFSSMECSWLSAHAIFVAAITVLYCVWMHPLVRGTTPMDTCLKRAEVALQLLSFLGQTWSVAREAGHKLDKLIRSTREAHESGAQGFGAESLHPNSGAWSDPSISMLRPNQDQDRTTGTADGRNLLIDELGVLRDLFDLGWLNDVGPDGNQTFFEP
ncbi:hypothetical protein BDV25DRAFT_136615 [Aspergillus avenaceus]|uniref:Xylanolytic transcriptional activator regulatory domain-containing protein n=1 Tax=Aspergillus avenaceus TaxID=36643 RepID=A0A5N6U4W4_ASPAV|nr:hypothetical protein BDV25DRAFT_136615 [Aspergillus avenaceus]